MLFSWYGLLMLLNFYFQLLVHQPEISQQIAWSNIDELIDFKNIIIAFTTSFCLSTPSLFEPIYYAVTLAYKLNTK